MSYYRPIKILVEVFPGKPSDKRYIILRRVETMSHSVLILARGVELPFLIWQVP